MAEVQNKEKEMQEKYMEFQLLERQMKQVQAQIEQLESQLNDVMILQQSLHELKSVNVGKEVLVPIGAGIFLNAELKNNQDVLVNVGSGIVVKKSIDGANELLGHQVREMQALEEERAKKLSELSEKAASIEQELTLLVEEE